MICSICKEDKDNSKYLHVLKDDPIICCTCKYKIKTGVDGLETLKKKTTCQFCKEKPIGGLRKKYCSDACAYEANIQNVRKNWRRKMTPSPNNWGNFTL